MKNFAVPESFSKFLNDEINSGVINKNLIDLRAFFQYVLDHSSKILYKTDFNADFTEELFKYVSLLYGGQNALKDDYIKENFKKISYEVLKLINDINLEYSQTLFTTGKFPLVLNGSPNYFTVEFSDSPIP